MADMKQSGAVRCVIVTPEQTSLDTQARSVTLPLFDGLRGVAHGHSPFIGRLGAGEVRIVGEQGGPADAVRRLFVEGGFVEVAHDQVTVITQRAVPAEKVDPAAARAEFEKISGTRATGDEAIAAKLRSEQAARALVRAAERRG
jgi:F-type H+-transporting ATPase subunit epsilon